MSSPADGLTRSGSFNLGGRKGSKKTPPIYSCACLNLQLTLDNKAVNADEAKLLLDEAEQQLFEQAFALSTTTASGLSVKRHSPTVGILDSKIIVIRSTHRSNIIFVHQKKSG
jgi:hypothetical protein